MPPEFLSLLIHPALSVYWHTLVHSISLVPGAPVENSTRSPPIIFWIFTPQIGQTWIPLLDITNPSARQKWIIPSWNAFRPEQVPLSVPLVISRGCNSVKEGSALLPHRRIYFSTPFSVLRLIAASHLLSHFAKRITDQTSLIFYGVSGTFCFRSLCFHKLCAQWFELRYGC